MEEEKLSVLEEEELQTEAAQQLSPKQRLALRMYVVGKSSKEIEEVAGYKPASLNWLKRQPHGEEYVKECQAELDEDFKRLFKKAIEVIEAGLDSDNANVALASVNLWMKASGKYVMRTEKRDLTAEDIVKKIMSGELRAPQRVPISIPGVIVSDEAEADEQELKH